MNEHEWPEEFPDPEIKKSIIKDDDTESLKEEVQGNNSKLSKIVLEIFASIGALFVVGFIGKMLFSIFFFLSSADSPFDGAITKPMFLFF